MKSRSNRNLGAAARNRIFIQSRRKAVSQAISKNAAGGKTRAGGRVPR